MDGHQQRGHLRNAAMEDLRRRTGGDGATIEPAAPGSMSRAARTLLPRKFVSPPRAIRSMHSSWAGRRSEALIKPLATVSKYSPPKIKNVELLGHGGKIEWTQDEQGLVVVMPDRKPCDHAITLKIT